LTLVLLVALIETALLARLLARLLSCANVLALLLPPVLGAEALLPVAAGLLLITEATTPVTNIGVTVDTKLACDEAHVLLPAAVSCRHNDEGPFHEVPGVVVDSALTAPTIAEEALSTVSGPEAVAVTFNAADRPGAENVGVPTTPADASQLVDAAVRRDTAASTPAAVVSTSDVTVNRRTDPVTGVNENVPPSDAAVAVRLVVNPATSVAVALFRVISRVHVKLDTATVAVGRPADFTDRASVYCAVGKL